MFKINGRGQSTSYLGKRTNGTLTLPAAKKYISQGLNTLLKNESESSTKGSVDKHKIRRIKKLYVRPEKKSCDVEMSMAPQTVGTDAPKLLSVIGSGTSRSARIGAKVQFSSTQWRFRVGLNSGTSPSCYRFIVFVDKQANGTQPYFSDLLENTTDAKAQITSPYKLENAKRFQVLYDHTDTLDSGQGLKNVEIGYIPLNIITEWKSASSGYASTDITTNSLWWGILSDADIDVYGRFRSRYFDC